MKIDILGIPYEVHSVGRNHESLKMDKGEPAYGRVYHRARKMYVSREDQSPGEQTSVLLHEVIHAISDRTGIDLKEGQVDALTTGIEYVMAKNKRFSKSLISRGK